MTKPPTSPPSDFSASDVLAPQFWTGRTERPAPGLDIACTKIAVDFQSLRRDTADEVIKASLEILRESVSADATFCAFFNAGSTHIESVTSSGGPFVQCHPEALRGVTLDRLPWLQSRADHLRISEFRDTATPRRDNSADSSNPTA